MKYKIIYRVNKTGETKEKEFITRGAQDQFLLFYSDVITVICFKSY